MIICEKCNKSIEIEDQDLDRELFDAGKYKVTQNCKKCLSDEKNKAAKQKQIEKENSNAEKLESSSLDSLKDT